MRAQPPASHYIDGEPCEDQAGAPFDSIHPADGSVIARLRQATPVVIDQVIASSLRGLHVWSAMSGATRGRVLRRAADIIRARNHELSLLETLDTGKPIAETLVADAASGADCLEYFGGLAAAISGEHIDLGGGPGGPFAYTRREPLGVCLGIGAWNYPVQIACWKAAPALAAGNAMIFKPSETTPLSALKLAEILTEAGLPPGVFNVVQGAGEVGDALVRRPEIAKVSVTGSVATGERVMQAAGIKPVTLELGGKSPLIICADANLDDAVGGAMLGNFYSSGQICSNATRVFVHASVRDAFLAKLVARTAKLRLGDPLDPATQIGPLVSARQQARVLDAIARGRQEGARLICGGKAWHAKGGHAKGGCFVEPTVFADVTDGMSLAGQEIFGPVMSVLTFTCEDDVIARANALEFGLAAGVFTADLTAAHRIAARLQAGICWINAYNVTPVEIPFGGSKRSGFGRENGRAALEHYTRLKTVYVGMGPVDAPY
jgi:betaine-aldehyde dehydrogenase